MRRLKELVTSSGYGSLEKWFMALGGSRGVANLRATSVEQTIIAKTAFEKGIKRMALQSQRMDLAFQDHEVRYVRVPVVCGVV